MATANEPILSELAAQFEANRARLCNIAALRMPEALARRISADDVVQETWLALTRRVEAFVQAKEIPVFIRFRTLLCQTLIDLEREHLVSQKRDAGREVEYDAEAPGNGDQTGLANRWNLLADTITSPRTHLEKAERYGLIRQILEQLPETDRTVIEMRNFENLSNLECAAALGIEPKAASIRYVRALQRFRGKLLENTEFQI